MRKKSAALSVKLTAFIENIGKNPTKLGEYCEFIESYNNITHEMKDSKLLDKMTEI